MFPRGRRVLALKAAAVAMLAWGCSALPTEPTPVSNASTPAFVRVPTGGAAAFGASGSGVSTNSKEIDGAKGGTLGCGNFKLIVPAGAYAGKATLTIVVPDAGVMRCQLNISPASANNFAVPVQLVSDCSASLNLDTSNLQTLWFNEFTARWVPVPGSVVTSSNSTITTPLMHFSDYGVVDSKAGW